MSTQKPDLDTEPGDLRQLLIPGDDQIDIRVPLRGGKDQSVRHSQWLGARPDVGSLTGNSDVNRQDRRKQAGEESRDFLLVVMPEASRGQNLGVGDYRCH